MSSKKPPERWPDAISEDASVVGAGNLLEAAEILAQRTYYGFVWLDTDLNAVSRYGRLADFVALGRPVSESVLPLIGLDNDIKALAAHPDHALSVPAVSIIDASGATPRINLTVLKLSHEAPSYLLLVSRAVSRSDAEYELTRQTRARLMAEAELVVKSRELARANRDLEDFASIVSHDLNAPMRAMRYLVDDLEAQIAEPDHGDAKGTIARIRGLSRRLTTMMNGLLEYSSIGRKRDAVEVVDTRALVEGVAQSIPRPPGLELVIGGEWPELETLAAPLDLVLRNLVDNAVKHHDKAEGLIEVTARDLPEALEIAVADDGPGIAVEHRAAVLLPFRKLSEGNEKPGSGLGLALVERTIVQLGGQLVVGSNARAGRGAMFKVSWPKCIRS